MCRPGRVTLFVVLVLVTHAFGAGAMKLGSSSSQERDLIAFRRLEVEDFRARSPLAGLAAHGRGVGVAACLSIVTDPELTGRVERESRESGPWTVVAEDLSFHAMLDRACSWWSRTSRFSKDYRLRHAQGHFAIFEIAARRATLRLRSTERIGEASGATPMEARKSFQKLIDESLDAALQDALDRGARFDQETVGTARPGPASRALQSRRRRWEEQLERELEETAASLRETSGGDRFFSGGFALQALRPGSGSRPRREAEGPVKTPSSSR